MSPQAAIGGPLVSGWSHTMCPRSGISLENSDIKASLDQLSSGCENRRTCANYGNSRCCGEGLHWV